MITIRHESCIMCGTCVMVCPVKALKAGATRIEHFPERCIDCSLCVNNCPVKVITLHKGIKDPAELPPETGR